MFKKKIALFNQSVKNKEEALALLANEFIKAGVVEDNFLEGILQREEAFPTGLELNKMGVAIPHTDSEYVKENQLGFMTLDKPVIFKFMGDASQDIEVSIIFMLALKEAESQIEMLSKLMDLFMFDEVMEALKTVDNYDGFDEIINKSGLLD
ncbi:MAG: PTS sugar transporter subunit IIA [Bacillota bacterium]|jgi:PTS system galactitol-specific IIA component|nr:PTS sugar transporter subunit IIA [Bacillota bacterium]NLL26978.1 PTS sugar transporter subunit IIA [Erysipelotrichia bacterium]